MSAGQNEKESEREVWKGGEAHSTSQARVHTLFSLLLLALFDKAVIVNGTERVNLG